MTSDNDLQSRQALRREALAAIRQDVSYSITLAEESNKARDKQQRRSLATAQPVGV